MSETETGLVTKTACGAWEHLGKSAVVEKIRSSDFVVPTTHIIWSTGATFLYFAETWIKSIRK